MYDSLFVQLFQVYLLRYTKNLAINDKPMITINDDQNWNQPLMCPSQKENIGYNGSAKPENQVANALSYPPNPRMHQPT